MKRKLQRFLALAACTLACHAWAEEAAMPLARLANGEVVSQQDMSDYLDRRMDLRPTARNAWGMEKVVEEMAMTRVLTLEGERQGLPRDSKAGEGAAPRFDDVYGLAVYRTLAPACEQPANEQEARKYFDAHPAAFQLPLQARVARIILPASATFGDQNALGWLQSQAMEIAQGHVKFADAAKSAEAAYTGDAQGDIGWLNLEGDNAIMRALQTVKAGELLGPVQDGDFVYLFAMVQRRDGRGLTWDEAKSFAATRAVTWCRQEASDKLRADLFQRYGVNIDREAIRALFAKQGGQK